MIIKWNVCIKSIRLYMYFLTNMLGSLLFTHMTLDGTMNPQVKNINENKLYPIFLKFFGWIFLKVKFICDIGIVQTYLVKWEEKRISVIPLPKFWENVGKKREKWCDGCGRERKKNFDNDIVKKKKEKRKTELWQE